MLNLISRLFGNGGLVRPRCERPLEGHSERECARKMSRRWFFGLCAGAVLAIPKPQTAMEIRLKEWAGGPTPYPAKFMMAFVREHSRPFTMEEFTRGAALLRNPRYSGGEWRGLHSTT